MKYKMLMCQALLLAGANSLYMILANFYLELDHENTLLTLNSLFITISVYVFYREHKYHLVIQKEAAIQKEASLEVNSSVELLQNSGQLLIDHFPDFLCLKDKDGRWLRASSTYLESFNLHNVNYIGKTDFELSHYPNSNAHALKLSAIQDKSVWHQGRQEKETRTIARGNNKGTAFEITRTPIFDDQKNKYQLIITGHVVDQDETGKASLALVSYAFQEGHLSFVFLDENFRIRKINAAFSLLTGYVIDEVENRHLSYIIDDKFDAVHARLFKNKDDKLWSEETTCRHKSGHVIPIKLDITAITTKNQDIIYFASLFDITQQKQSEKRIMQIAHYDDLTGLVNRVMFFDRLSQFLLKSKLQQVYAVIFFIDLDRFKAVNDSLGHDAGDELLKETASRLLAEIREEDLVARLSGDEFAVLLLNIISYDQAVYSASMVAGKIIQSLSKVFHIHRSEVFISASIGISIYPEDGVSSEILLKHADIAMYEAKKQGSNNYQFYKKAYMDATQDRHTLELNLRKALEKNELQLFYQPQYKAKNNELCGAEVLIRWFQDSSSGQKKMISPCHFIGIAEETGLIVEIGKWILRIACIQLKEWLVEGYPLQRLSVNVSARQFKDNNFLKIVEDALQEADLPPQHLELEITESIFIGDTRQIELQLNRLKKMGIAIVLDDFGTGYSSLSYLKDFPIDVLKIDQSFVRGTALQSKNARIACAIIDMGHSLGQKIVAEGVETEEQLIYLRDRGCDIIQGYYFSPPLPKEKMTALLRSEAVGFGKKKQKGLFE